MNPIETIDINFHQRVAIAYGEMKHNPEGKAVRQAYFQLAVETISQYQMILTYGLQVEFSSTESPYKWPNDALADIANNNHLFVTPIGENFGSNEDFKPTGNPLLNESSFYISGQPALINDLFRVVHGYFGHFKGRSGFRALGEENAYRYHCTMFSPLAQKALTTETRGQNSWLNYGPHGEHNQNAKQADTIFADQKTGLLPAFCMEAY